MSNQKSFLEDKALFIRRQILETIVAAKKGHIGGAYSCADILVALYYGNILRFDPNNPAMDNRDRFILSKGHSCVALYAILADLGFFDASELDSYCRYGSMLGGHPDKSIPGIEADTGSLGHGLGLSAGLALGAKLDKKEYMTVVLLGDGECYEGAVWESALFAAHHKLDNLVALVDRNQQCVTDFTKDCNRLEPFSDKWRKFGWEAREIDGHSFKEILAALKDFRHRTSNKPMVVIASTIKGKGVSYMERNLPWHHSVPSGDELIIARKELESTD